jgi:hypothetical protein
MVLLVCFQGCANRLRPGAERIDILLRESRVIVHQAVGKGRHPFLPHFFADQAQVLGGFLGILLRLPILKVDVPTARVDVVDDQPGYRREVAVPGPHGSAGMTITTRPVQDGHDIGRHWHVRLEGSRRDDGRIGPRRLHELSYQKESYQGSYEYLRPSHVHRRIPLRSVMLQTGGVHNAPSALTSLRDKNIYSGVVYLFPSHSPIWSVFMAVIV